MNDSDFVVAFNILDSGYRQWWFPAIGLLVLTVGIVILNQKKRKNAAFKKAGLIIFCLLWTLAAFAITYVDYSNCYHALSSGEASYVEGTVDNFVQLPDQWNEKKESFTVNGVPFSYSDYVVTAGFNKTRSHGGPIHQGLPVRIWYVGNEIVKLEIKR